jgi:ribose transport system permease protein
MMIKQENKLRRREIQTFFTENAVSIILTLFVIFMIFQRPSFRSWGNITTILNDCCMYGITALAMTAVVICGEIDLSVSSIYAWATCLFVILCNGMNMWLAALITLATGVVWGILNGLLVARIRMPAFVATLGTMYTIMGLAYYITKEKPVNTSNQTLAAIGRINIAGISLVPIVFLLVLAFLYWFLRYTVQGRGIYAAGGNYEVARLSGINVRYSKVLVFVLTGFCSALSGILYCTRIFSGAATYGTDLTIWCVAATVIGGTSMAGGSGSVNRTIIGILLMAILFNALTLMGVDGSMQRFIRGLVLIVVILFDAAARMKKVA